MKETIPSVLEPGDSPPSVIREVVVKLEAAEPWDYKVKKVCLLWSWREN